ncbi:hypothetical protein ACFXON_24630, partial [Bacillus subtilis]
FMGWVTDPVQAALPAILVPGRTTNGSRSSSSPIRRAHTARHAGSTPWNFVRWVVPAQVSDDAMS